MSQPNHIQIPDPIQSPTTSRDEARLAAINYAHGQLPKEDLHYLGVPRGHPVVRSFLGVPLLDRDREVRGGLLLGHSEPGRFTAEDEELLAGLAAQAAVALENARLYRTAQMRAQQLDAIFDSITDGVTLVDHQGNILRENGSARRLRKLLESHPEGERFEEALLHTPTPRALRGETIQNNTTTVVDSGNETREYLVNASPLHLPITPSDPLSQIHDGTSPAQHNVSGAVVVWHDVTEARRLLIEQQRFSNVIGNAIKYSPAGGIIKLVIHEDVERESALLSIQDNGIGIPTQQQARIFGRFERADNARTYGITGTGLGLYLCRELVERQGGRVWFESAEGQGSTFYITLPLVVDTSSDL